MSEAARRSSEKGQVSRGVPAGLEPYVRLPVHLTMRYTRVQVSSAAVAALREGLPSAGYLSRTGRVV